MAGNIPVISTLVPQNDGNFATHDSTYGKGGWHEVTTLADRDAIPAERRRAGMAVNVIMANQVFQLGGDLSTWVLLSMGGSGGIGEAPIDGAGYVRSMAAWDPIDEYLDGGVLV